MAETEARESAEKISLEETERIIARYMRVIKIKAAKLKSAVLKSGAIDADDLASEGFLGLLSAIRTYDKEKGSFSAYANVCIANKMKSAALKFSSPPQWKADDFDFSEIPDKSLTEELVIEKESESEIFNKLFELLTEKELKSFTLYLKGYSYGQIARQLSSTVKAVDNSLFRARAKLRNYYN